MPPILSLPADYLVQLPSPSLPDLSAARNRLCYPTLLLKANHEALIHTDLSSLLPSYPNLRSPITTLHRPQLVRYLYSRQ